MHTKSKQHDLQKLIKHDLKRGLLSRWGLFVFAVLLFLCFCIMFIQSIDTVKESGVNLPSASFIDYMIYIFEGMEVYIPNPKEPFKISLIWISIQMYIAFIVSYYPTNDLKGFGKYVLVRTINRRSWWISKSLWCLMNVLCFYLTGYITVYVFSIFGGNNSLIPSLEINTLISKINVESVELGSLFLFIVLAPVITSIAISLFQLACNMILKPIYSYMLVIFVMVISAYYKSPLLIGNNSMLLRSSLVVSDGITLLTSIFVNVAIIIGAFICGYISFNKKDILDKRI